MKISFNDKSLQTTFEYPPESSLQEAEAEEEEEGTQRRMRRLTALMVQRRSPSRSSCPGPRL